MKTRLVVSVLAALSAVGLLALILPAWAADTITTFSLTGGSLTVSAPATKNLGSAATGSASISTTLGNVTVTDARGLLGGSWTASVSSTNFTTGSATANETINKSNATYLSGTATTSGVATFTPGQLVAEDLSTSRTAYSAAVIVGNNSATWNPTVTVNIPAAAVAGTYTGTITHSVA
ncbi:MAG: hypothetical protein ACRDJ4_13105 [Actinomycetota bacterium]